MRTYQQLNVCEQGGRFTVRLPDHRIIHQWEIKQVVGQLQELAARHDCQVMLLDLSNVDRLSSEVLGKLLTVNRRLRQRKAELILCRLKPTLRTVFEWTKLDQVFQIHEN
jgi:anti-anti-sigma factor